MEVLRRRLSSGWMRNPLKRNSNSDAPPPVPKDDPRASFPPTHSILPDKMSVSYDVWDAVPLPGYHRFYPIHNPVGPRFYRNIHLIPPSQIRPGARPPSVFSPSFPPISSSDAGPPSASRSTLPTPSSSQTRVADGSKQRPRKTSQGAPDNVDLMDVTDPWGTNWHHTSPYDIGLPATSNSDNYDLPRRPRHASMTAAQTGYQTTSKSPLSQSTSAVHEFPSIHLPRKLSKRHKPSAATNKRDTEPEKTVLLTHTVEQNPQLPKRMSVAPPLGHPTNLSSHPSLKKEKRGSMLDRFARKLSFIRRSFDGYGRSPQPEDDWQHVNAADTRSIIQSHEPQESIIPHVKDTQERSSVKRIPPPSIDTSYAAPRHRKDDSGSSISVEAPFSIGRLTIANPDIPSESPSHIGPTGHSGNPPSPPPKSVHPPILPPTPVPPPIAKNDLPPQPRLSHSSSPTSASSDDQTTPRAADVSLEPGTPLVPPRPILEPAPGRASTSYSTAPSHLHSPLPPQVSNRPLSTLESVISSNTAATAATSSIPFPGPSSHGGGLQSDVNYDLDDSRSYLSYVDTPLSNISVLVNPPTPYTGDGGMTMPATPQVPQPVPIPSSKPAAKSPLSQPPVTVTSSHSPSPQLTQENSKSSSRRTTVTVVHDPEQHHSTNGLRLADREKEREREKEKEREKAHKRESRREREREHEKRESRVHQEESDKRRSYRHTMKSSPESSTGNGVNGRPVSNSGHGGQGARRESSLSRQEDQLRRDKEREREEQAKRERAREREEQARRERAREKEEQARREKEREREEQIRREREREREREERSRRERERERDEQIRREREREREEQTRREREREREEQARRERERDERIRREWEEHLRREKEREEQAKREREKEEQAWREKEEELRKQLEELARKEEERKEKEEQRRKERERERERKEREREERRVKEKEKEREERKRRKEERRSKEEKEKKERKSKEEHRSRGHRGGNEDRRTRDEKDRHRDHRSHDKEKEERRHRREKEKHSKSERMDNPTEKPNVNKPQPPPPPVESSESSSTDVPLARQPSTSVRPTSELPSAADLNAVRAKEAWEMERLWKARSMYGIEANGVKPSTVPSTDFSAASSSIDAQVAMTMGMNLGPGTTNGVHGSSHTAFVVQNSLRPPQPPYAFYSPVPLATANGSGCFPSPPTIPSLRESITSYDIPSDVALLNGTGPYRYGGYYGPYGGSSPGLLGPSGAGGGVDSPERKDYMEKDLPLRSNPLPVPPRESTYEPKPADYWIGYSSVTTSV